MKNIHLLPTDKPSRLYKTGNFLLLDSKAMPNNTLETQNQNIYITSDEKIKEGVNQWYLDKVLNKPRNSSGSQYGEKQDVIILTDNKDLIADGVQPIDDEFLEWFVGNPSCEEVEVVGDDCYYEIIIPKEEPKQETPESIIQDIATHLSKTVPETLQHIEEFSKELDKLKSKQETLERGITITHVGKQETLEEEEVRKYAELSYYNGDEVNAFVSGAKWQSKRMYSEEDMLDFAWYLIKNVGQYSDDRIAHFEGKYLEQFKKK